jgi:hypothetical protein
MVMTVKFTINAHTQILNTKKGRGKKGTDIHVTGHGGTYGCERLRLPHYLDKWLLDGGKVVSPTRRPHFIPRFFFFFLRFLVLISVRG